MRPTDEARLRAHTLQAAGVRSCRSCKKILPCWEFTKQARGLGGYRPTCKPCTSAANKVRYERDKDPEAIRIKSREAYRRRAGRLKFQKYLHEKYRVTLAEWDRRMIDQSGRCEICSVAMHQPALDHCHTTGKARGILCRKCNSGLGMFRDDLELLRSAVRYLAC